MAVSGKAAQDYRKEFISFCVERGALQFGRFVTKSGRVSPYFFNAGAFSTGAALDRLAQFYARAIIDSGVKFDMLFGPAYKGIPLALATSMALARQGRDVSYAFNRKEEKDHGEGGNVIGAPLAGQVLIVDDVITAGTAFRESLRVIQSSGATAAGLAICLDRMERGEGKLSAIQELEQQRGIPVITVSNLDDLLDWLRERADMREHVQGVEEYRKLYGAVQHA
jgi:orotate phosphoribosyltransferase